MSRQFTPPLHDRVLRNENAKLREEVVQLRAEVEFFKGVIRHDPKLADLARHAGYNPLYLDWKVSEQQIKQWAVLHKAHARKK